MYQKAMLFQDEDMASKIMATKDPKKQKGYGRKVANFDGLKWDLEKVRIVEEGNYHKFMHPAEGGEGDKLRLMLLETGARKLYEASPFDRIWGIGFHALNAEAFESAWGENLLGKAIESTRATIQRELAEKGHSV